MLSVANWFKSNMLDNKENTSMLTLLYELPFWDFFFSDFMWTPKYDLCYSSHVLLFTLAYNTQLLSLPIRIVPDSSVFSAKATMDSSLLCHLPLRTCSTCCLCLFFDSYKILCLILILGYVLYLIFICNFLYSWLYIVDCTF